MSKSIALGASVLVLSTSVNAVVLNTLNGIDYEWLELTKTIGVGRDEIELRLADPNDSLYGYEYASRQLIEDLFSSYVIWDGVNGVHGLSSGFVSGYSQLVNDFGPTSTSAIANTIRTVEGVLIESAEKFSLRGLYGSEDECGIGKTCLAISDLNLSSDGIAIGASIYSYNGWDSSANIFGRSSDASDGFNGYGSYVVLRTSEVPIPAAAWLFGSGLLGLVSTARRKKA